MILVSNGDATDEEYNDLKKGRKDNNLKMITFGFVKSKLADFKQAESYEYRDSEIEEMVQKNISKRLKEGKVAGFNLSY